MEAHFWVEGVGVTPRIIALILHSSFSNVLAANENLFFFIGGGNKNKNLGRTRLQHHRYKSILVINLGQVFRTTLAQLKKLNKNVFMHSTSKKTVTMSLMTKNLNLATIFCIFTLFPLRAKQVGRWQI